MIVERWSEVQSLFRHWVDSMSDSARITLMHDSDADGVSSAAVLTRALRTFGRKPVTVAPDRERDAWSASNAQRVRASRPDALAVMDLGARAEPLVPGVRTLFIDHHRPESVGSGDILISAYDWDPIPNTSLLAYHCAAAICDAADLDWIAALGVLSDLGDKAPFPLLARVRERYSISRLREITTLINAARRGPVHQPEIALRLLLNHDSPESLEQDGGDDLETLRSAREIVKRELAQAKKAAPVFSGDVALIRTSSRCQVHPIIAQIWRTRLPKYVVIASNDGYLEGRVNFSMRTASDRNLLDFLGGIDLGPGEGSYGRGHDQATGGSLDIERWNLLLHRLGFS